MHKKILEDATLEQLKCFIDYAIKEAKSYDEKLYDTMEMILYKKVYGYHFSDWMLAKALQGMVNEDGTHGGHWSVADTTAVAKQYGISFVDFNEFDWNYVMNMIYSDYYGSIPDDVSGYVKLAEKFIKDKDAGVGKAFKYYVAMNYDDLY